MPKMELRPEEWQELVDLMQKARYVRPDPLRERRLRELLALRDREALEMAWHDLREFGLVVLGVHFIRKIYS